MVRKADRLRTFLTGELLTSGFVRSEKLLAAPMRLWRRQLDEQITDPQLRERCTPDYVIGCKRVLFSNDWYPTLARPDVELVTDAIERIVPGGVVTAGGTVRAGGRDHLRDRVPDPRLPGAHVGDRPGAGGSCTRPGATGPRRTSGSLCPGFPNFFMLYGPNTNLGGNSIIYMLEGQIGYVLGAIGALEREGLDWLDVRPEVQKAFTTWVDAASRTSVWESGCHSWYTTASGRNTNNWPDMTFRYRQRVRHFDLSGYRVMPKRPATATPGTGAA